MFTPITSFEELHNAYPDSCIFENLETAEEKAAIQRRLDGPELFLRTPKGYVRGFDAYMGSVQTKDSKVLIIEDVLPHGDISMIEELVMWTRGQNYLDLLIKEAYEMRHLASQGYEFNKQHFFQANATWVSPVLPEYYQVLGCNRTFNARFYSFFEDFEVKIE